MFLKPVLMLKPHRGPGATEVFFRKIFILQLVGSVLTYNFTDCNFKKIREDYQKVIFTSLSSDMTRPRRIRHKTDNCHTPPECLTIIEHLTFSPTPDCKSPDKGMLAIKTNATFTRECPGYSGRQINNSQAMNKTEKREDTIDECQEIVLNLLGLWRRFTRSSQTK